METREASPITIFEAPPVQSRVEMREVPPVMILNDTGDVSDLYILNFRQRSARLSELDKKLLEFEEHVIDLDDVAPHATKYRTPSTKVTGTKQVCGTLYVGLCTSSLDSKFECLM